MCGIATFTSDLAEAVASHAGKHQPVIATAMNDRPEGYAYPDRVKFEVRQDYPVDYSRAADFLNFSRVDVISLQHEYGIFGGEWGSNLLTLVRDLRRPVVMTCHTVVKEPDAAQKEVFVELAARAAKCVVMSQRGVEFLKDVYGVNPDKVALIPHGIHDVPFIDPNYYKDKFGVEGRRILLTFGLLHRNKGIEYMIEALPAIVERHPDTTYLILGATHPNVVADEGEAYRLSLQRRVRELGVENNVLFHARFVELDELLEYIGAADICVTPYLNPEQITSGALSYCMGSGKAVISTPYWHAAELLDGGRGRLVPMRDSKALAAAVNDLLDDEVVLTATRKKAYLYCRPMTWASVGASYVQLFDEVRSHVPKSIPTASDVRREISASNLPLPKLDHLVRLSDGTGPAHHARHTIPDWGFGYRLEDAAGALVASAKYYKTFADRSALHVAEKCLALVQTLIGNGKDVAEGLDYTRVRLGKASDLSVGKAVWALGYVVTNGPSVLATAAMDLFQEMLPHAVLSSPQAASYAVLGAANYLSRFPGASDVRRFLTKHTDLVAKSCRTPLWRDRWGTADWPVAIQALMVASSSLGRKELKDQALAMVKELLETTSNGTVFLRPGENPDEEELPASAAAFIEALGAFYYDGRDPSLLAPIRNAADWFLGVNRKGTPLYELSTGGCHDAITAAGLNSNQGTEATVYCLIALATLHRLAGIESHRKLG
jgi:glycosyltransferase involved in cell wall biosynthesis